MRRQFNGGSQPFNYGSGFRSRFPSEFDDPFGKRTYESSIYGGAFRDPEPRELFNPYDSLDRGGSFRDDYSRLDYPNKFNNRNWDTSSSNMNVDSFLKLGNLSRRNPYMRTYGNNLPDELPQQRNQSMYPRQIERQSPIDDMQIQNTKNGNNFTAFDEEPENNQDKPFPGRISTEFSLPGWNPVKEEKYKVVDVKCKVCNITLTSKGVYEVHIQGKKHLKKEADAKKYSCDLCCTQMFTMEDQKAHNESKLN